MKAVLLVLVLVLLAVAVDFGAFGFHYSARAWDASFNSPNYACNFDEDCIVRTITPSDPCGTLKCVARSWQPIEFPFLPSGATFCSNQVDPLPESCECSNYSCRTK